MCRTKIEREWGTYSIINSVPGQHVTKMLEFNGRGRTSIQRHRNRAEVWFCVKGKVHLVVEGEEWWLHPGDKLTIPAGNWHEAWSEEPGAQVVEVWLSQIPGGLREDDIERKDSWK